MAFISKKKEIGSLLKEGNHVVTIISVKPEEYTSHLDKEWVGGTKRTVFNCKTASNEHALISLWEEGFYSFEDLPADIASDYYRVDTDDSGINNVAVHKKTKMRLQSPEKTEVCNEIIGNFLYSIGVEENVSLETMDEVRDYALDRQCGVFVAETGIVKYTTTVEEALEKKSNEVAPVSSAELVSEL